MDPATVLPSELMVDILRRVGGATEKFQLLWVSRRWRQLALDEVVWRGVNLESKVLHAALLAQIVEPGRTLHTSLKLYGYSLDKIAKMRATGRRVDRLGHVVGDVTLKSGSLQNMQQLLALAAGDAVTDLTIHDCWVEGNELATALPSYRNLRCVRLTERGIDRKPTPYGTRRPHILDLVEIIACVPSVETMVVEGTQLYQEVPRHPLADFVSPLRTLDARRVSWALRNHQGFFSAQRFPRLECLSLRTSSEETFVDADEFGKDGPPPLRELNVTIMAPLQCVYPYLERLTLHSRGEYAIYSDPTSLPSITSVSIVLIRPLENRASYRAQLLAFFRDLPSLRTLMVEAPVRKDMQSEAGDALASAAPELGVTVSAVLFEDSEASGAAADKYTYSRSL